MASSGVVIVGGGIVGVVTAYYLARAGVASVVVERDAIGSHASGFAYGGLSPVTGAGIPGPLAEVAQAGMRLHRELAEHVVAETGIDIDFRVRPSLALAFTEAEARRLQAALPWQQQQSGYTARWLDGAEARRVEPRVSEEAIGGVAIDGTADVEPYRLVLALTRAAEQLGASVRHGRITGLRREGARVTHVVLERTEIACDTVVLALGPWSAEASSWLDLPIEVRPLKGQILRLQAPGPPVPCSVGWGHNYATTKPDGLLWAGTTEEEAGFDEEGRIQALELTLASRCGVSPDLSGPVNDRAVLHSDNAYYLPHVQVTSHRCRTNTASNTAFRGFGGPQGMAVIETVIDRIARFLKLDAADVRERNFYGAGTGAARSAPTW